MGAISGTGWHTTIWLTPRPPSPPSKPPSPPCACPGGPCSGPVSPVYPRLLPHAALLHGLQGTSQAASPDTALSPGHSDSVDQSAQDHDTKSTGCVVAVVFVARPVPSGGTPSKNIHVFCRRRTADRDRDRLGTWAGEDGDSEHAAPPIVSKGETRPQGEPHCRLTLTSHAGTRTGALGRGLSACLGDAWAGALCCRVLPAIRAL